MTTRLYVVTEIESGAEFLVEAATQAQAIRHVVNNTYSARVATSKEVAVLMQAGHVPEVAGDDLPDRPALTEMVAIRKQNRASGNA